MYKNLRIVFLITLSLFAGELQAQINNEFQIANRLMQQQRYEDALVILEKLSGQHPNTYLYFDRLIECKVQMKEYDEAISMVESNIDLQRSVGPSRILLGELYHLKGDTSAAYSIWDRNLTNFSDQLQIYVNTASAMIERRAYKKAIEVYKKGRVHFNNEMLFMTEVPNTYLQGGMYEEAIAEWLNLIQVNPQQMYGVQRLLMRYNDPILYDITIIELEDIIARTELKDPAYKEFYTLLEWLLLENKLYRRAYATALEYESRTSNYNYSLFNVGRDLVNNNEFELAIDAFNFYIERTNGEVSWLAVEEKAEAMTRWAKYLADNSLGARGKKDSLYNYSVSLLDTLISETRTYSRMSDVYIKRAELALDHVFDLNKAQQATDQLKKLPDMNDTPESNYLDGRIFLAQREFTSARISFTRSNKKAESGPMAEKTRYFLALTDFYAGDFEFAQIQLKSLGRQNTSYYANDALELRLWVQDGLAEDTTGAVIKPFAEAHYQYSVGNNAEAEQQLLAIANSTAPTPFKDDAYILMAKKSENQSLEYVSSISQFLENTPYLSMRERLMWERTRVVEGAYSLGNEENILFNGTPILERLINYYEELILEYPQGFYAPYARKRLNELPKANS